MARFKARVVGLIAVTAIAIGIATLVFWQDPLLTAQAAQKNTTYVVQSGDSLTAIADKFNVSVEALAAANGLNFRGPLYRGMELTIPDTQSSSASAAGAEAAVMAESTAAPTEEMMEEAADESSAESSDESSLESTAEPTEEMSEEAMPAATEAATETVTAATVETIAAPANPTRTYKVKAGDSVTAIADRFNVSPGAIIAANNLPPHTPLYRGTILIIPSNNAAVSAAPQAAATATETATEEAMAEEAAAEEATAEEATAEVTPTPEATEEMAEEAEATETATEEPAEEPTEEMMEATPEATAEAGEEAAAEAMAQEATAEPSAEATEEMLEEATETATAEATVTATEEAGEEAIAEATTEPTEEPTEEMMEEPTAEPTEEATEEATAEPTGEPTEEPTAEPTAEPTEEMVEEGTILDTITDLGDFSVLLEALDAAGLSATLEGEGPFTLFAPTDAAFEALPAGTIEGLLASPPDDLSQVLLYHILPGKVLTEDFVDGVTVITAQGGTVTLGVTPEGFTVNDANITISDIETSNGVIHVIDAVLLPSGDVAAVPKSTAAPATSEAASGDAASVIIAPAQVSDMAAAAQLWPQPDTAIVVYSPAAAGGYHSPLEVVGLSNTYGGNLAINLTAADGTMLAQRMTLGGDERYAFFHTSLRFFVDDRTDATLSVNEIDMADGSVINAVGTPVTLLPGQRFLDVNMPVVGAMVCPPILISGYSNTFEANIVLTLRQPDGEILLQQPTIGGTLGFYRDFATPLPYTVDKATPLLVSVHDTDASGQLSTIDETIIPVTLYPAYSAVCY